MLLAARLPSTTHVFALTSLGVLCFMLLPALSRTLHALPATQARLRLRLRLRVRVRVRLRVRVRDRVRVRV